MTTGDDLAFDTRLDFTNPLDPLFYSHFTYHPTWERRWVIWSWLGPKVCGSGVECHGWSSCRIVGLLVPISVIVIFSGFILRAGQHQVLARL